MEGRYTVWIAVAIIALMLFFGMIGAGQAQSTATDHIQLYVNGVLVYDNQPDEPTPTPEPTATPEPEPTNTPTPEPVGQVEPYPDAPACSEHDPLDLTHSIWNSDAGCYYDHSHLPAGFDPADTIFAAEVADWSLDFAWQTFSGSTADPGDPYPQPGPDAVFENEGKHRGFKLLYDDSGDHCAQGNNPCVTHALVQFHTVGTSAAMPTRYHSWRGIFRACYDNGECGFLESGGWSDYGTLHCPYKDTHCPLPSDQPGLDENMLAGQPPYRATINVDEAGVIDGALEREAVLQLWSSLLNPVGFDDYPHRPNRLAAFVWGFNDSWGGVHKDDPFTQHYFCEDGSCPLNHSRAFWRTISLRLDDYLRRYVEDGFINFDGYADRWGHPVDGCTEPGLDCVPTRFDNFPADSYFVERLISDPAYGPVRYQFDVCFDDAGDWYVPEADPRVAPEGCTAGWLQP